MKPPLKGIEAKLDRAAHHLETLDAEIRKFTKRKTHSVFGEYDSKTSRYVFKIAIREQPPPKIGVVLGDVVHNLRSALDHLVAQLVLQAGGTVTRKTGFPVYSHPDRFRSDITIPGGRGKPNALHGLEGTPAWQAIEDLQPYHRRADNILLGGLHDLWNEDKHRVVLQAITGVRDPGPDHVFEAIPIRDIGEFGTATVRTGEPLEDGTEIMWVDIVPTGPNPEMKMKGDLTLDVAFGEGTIKGEYLPAMCSAAARVIVDFEKRFF